MIRKSLTLLMGSALCLAGCNQFLAERMVDAPNKHSPLRGFTPATPAAAMEDTARVHLQIPVGAPEATLAVWVLEPKKGVAARGTVLFLHGFLSNHWQLEGEAHALREAGYRSVLVDLRGHGESTGDLITYGVRDAQDLSHVTTYLQERGLCGKTIGVYGTSYGAATAILFAGADPRVTAVVAIAPFSSLREEAPYYGRNILPIPGRFMSDADYVGIVDTMGRLASFDPDACSPLAAIRETKAHVRLFHGDLDLIIPFTSSEAIAAAAPERTEFTKVQGIGHMALCFDPLGTLHRPTKEWFDRHLGMAASDK